MNLSTHKTQINGGEGETLKIIELLKQNGIYSFYHLTKCDNINSILNTGAILSQNSIKNKGIIANYSTNELSKELDERNNTSDFIHLSFHKFPPLSSKFLSSNSQSPYVLFAVNIEILLHQEFLFSDVNAASNQADFFSDIEKLKTLDFALFKKNRLG